MFDFRASIRFWITAFVLIAAFVLLRAVSHGESIAPRQPLREVPYTLGEWNGKEQPIQADIVQAVGVSDYTNRVYFHASNRPVDLYVGYYASQRTGDTIHSPKNCLPGAGWDPVRSGYATISLPGGNRIEVNEYVVQHDTERQLVFYWYQGRGRIIASEYASKFWMVADSITRNRTDSALVRLNTSMNDSEQNARARLTTLAELLFPRLSESIPN